MELKTNMHTIFMLIGATNSGKSTFAKEILLPQLSIQDKDRGFKTNVQYISSDEIRQDILGHEYDKHDRIMMESSEQAFHILFEKLKAVTSFPINAEFVIVDTIGLSEEFREQIMEIAKEKQYNLEAILFDFKNREDFYASGGSRRLISNHVTRLKREVLKQISKSKFRRIHKIRERDFYNPDTNEPNANYKIMIEDLDHYLSHILPQEHKYIIVGDVHEKVADLKKLLISYGFNIENNRILSTEKTDEYKIILNGDWIDKGNATKETVEFIEQNMDHFVLVKGNHENFVYKYLKGEIDKNSVDSSLLDNYFDSIEIFEKDEDLKHKFFRLVESSKEFYRYIGLQKPSFYVTHAPCQNKYIGKLDKTSLKKQRSFVLDREKPYEEQLHFLESESVGNHPYHIFGHVAVKEIVQIKNKINIDTGAANGNVLSSVVIDSWRPFFKQQRITSTSKYWNEPLPTLFKQRDKHVNIEDLHEQDQKRLNYVLKNKINYISGTMSPADKDLDSNELESLKQGLLYFKRKGVHKVVLQPKYMGSRCNIYLARELDQCYAVSRNGFKIKKVDLSPVYDNLLNKFSDYMKENKIKTIVFDGELLPWSILGEELIEKQFRTIDRALQTELDFLKEQGFDAHFQKLVEQYKSSDYEVDQQTMSKKDLIKKFGGATYQTYKALQTMLKSYEPIEKHVEAHQKYHEQIELYAKDDEINYKPFNILKMVKENGEEIIPAESTSEIFKFVSDDEFMLIDLNEQDYYEKALTFFKTLTTERKMEGVVIKPEKLADDTAPYMKVRNPDYLTIVYGYDYRFPHKYAKLLKQKNISKKLKTSINEFKLGKEMLAFHLDKINESDHKYKQVVANMLFEVSKEKEIDPRL
ncbi:MAG: metallophosphoesterase [Bacillaceae bacterium]|nr:metallophosphoesterase [Bacillaceae bacterium]